MITGSTHLLPLTSRSKKLRSEGSQLTTRRFWRRRVASLTEERNRLAAHVVKLDGQFREAQAQIPTTNQRRRQNKQKGRLERAERELEAASRDLQELRGERDRLIQVRKEVEDQLAEAEEDRSIAQRKSQISRTTAGVAERAGGIPPPKP